MSVITGTGNSESIYILCGIHLGPGSWPGYFYPKVLPAFIAMREYPYVTARVRSYHQGIGENMCIRTYKT